MNRSLRQLRKFIVYAPNAEIGRADRFFVDQECWTVRYIGIPSRESPRRLYLVSPLSLSGIDWLHRRIQTRTTRREMEGAPEINAEEPISRGEEVEYNRYFRLPRYWGGVGLWGNQPLPFLLVRACGPERPHELSGSAASAPERPHELSGSAASAPERRRRRAPEEWEASPEEWEASPEEWEASHLVSSSELLLASLHCPEGLVGPVADLLMDEASWAIRFLVVDAGRELPPEKLIVDPSWVQWHDRSDNRLHVGLPRAAIRGATEIQEVDPWKF